MPTVPVFDLVVKDESLVVSTYGRSAWIFDHLSVVRGLAEKRPSDSAYLFASPPAYQWLYSDSFEGAAGLDKWAGENPPAGVAIDYWLGGSSPANTITIDISDSTGHQIRKFENSQRQTMDGEAKTTQAPEKMEGHFPRKSTNVLLWDLRFAGPRLIPKATYLSFDDPSQGPLVLPGNYTVRLTVAGQSFERQVTVLPDPRSTTPAPALRDRLQYLLELRDQINKLSEIVVNLQSERSRLRGVVAKLHRDAHLTKSSADPEKLSSKLNELEEQFQNRDAQNVYDIIAAPGGTRLYSRMCTLYGWMNASDGVVTDGMRQVLTEQSVELSTLENRWIALKAEVARFIDAAARNLE